MIIITVNKHVILANKKHGTNAPPIGIRKTRSAKAEYVHGIEIHGPSKLVYAPDNPLKCGARLWIETDSGYTKI